MYPRLLTDKERSTVLKALQGEPLSVEERNLLYVLEHRARKFNDRIKEDLELLEALHFELEEKIIWFFVSEVPDKLKIPFLCFWAGLYSKYVARGRKMTEWNRLVGDIQLWMEKHGVVKR